MRKLFFVISVVGSVFFMTACGLNEEENITPSIDEMVVAPAATDSIYFPHAFLLQHHTDT